MAEAGPSHAPTRATRKTACLYISPPRDLTRPLETVIPCVFADVMATRADTPEGAQVLPGNLTIDNQAIDSSVRLVRKLNIIDRGAFAFCGDGDPIHDSLYDIAYLLPGLSEYERPMGEIVRRVDARNRQLGGVRHQVIGCIANADGRLNFGGPTASLTDIPLMGRVIAIGTGRHDLLQYCDLVSSQLTAQTPPLERAFLLFATINGRRLAEELLEEIAGRRREVRSWGGYTEWAYHLRANDLRWTRGPSTLHLFMMVANRENGERGIKLLHKYVAYDAPSGKILAFTRGPTGAVRAQFQFREMLVSTVEEPLGGDDVFWRSWRPQACVATILGRTEGVEQTYVDAIWSSEEELAEHVFFEWIEPFGFHFGHTPAHRATYERRVLEHLHAF